jgi:hypothetical protein
MVGVGLRPPPLVFAYKATKAVRIAGMGPGDYHSVDALGYDSLDNI